MRRLPMLGVAVLLALALAGPALAGSAPPLLPSRVDCSPDKRMVANPEFYDGINRRAGDLCPRAFEF